MGTYEARPLDVSIWESEVAVSANGTVLLYGTDLILKSSFGDVGLADIGYGRSVSVSEDNIVVGAPLYDNLRDDCGVVASYEWKDPGLKFTFEGDAIRGNFGYAVASDGRIFAGGTPGDGSATVMEMIGGSSFNVTRIVSRPPLLLGSKFGESIDVAMPTGGSSSHLVVGAPFGANFSGVAFVFESKKTGMWDQAAMLLNPTNSTKFGRQVVINEDYVMIAANSFVFLFNRGGWTLNYTFSSALDGFGESIAVFGDVALVGAPKEGLGVIAYYVRDSVGGWNMSRLIRPTDSGVSQFALDMDLHGDYIVVTALPNKAILLGPCTGIEYAVNGTCEVCDGIVALENTFCADCDFNEYFDSVFLECRVCPVGQVPALSQLECETCDGNDTITNLVILRCERCEDGLVPNDARDECVEPSSESSSDTLLSSNNALGAILGSVAGAGVVGVVLLCACLACCCIVVILLVLVALFVILVLVVVVLAVVVVVAVGVAGLGGAGGGAALIVRAKGGGESQPEDPFAAIIAHVQATSDFRHIAYDELQVGKKLADGSSGAVYEGQWSGVRVAIKKVNVADTKTFSREVLILAKVSHHPYLVQLVGACVEPERLALILRYYEGGPLDVALRGRKLDAHAKRRVLGEVASALAFLHSVGVIHRDVSARNVLLDGDQSAHLSDLGLARDDSTLAESKDGGDVGPFRWMAPEALRERSFSSASDTWSFGVLMWEVWSDGAVPYGELSTLSEVLNAVVREKQTLPPPMAMPSDHVEIFRGFQHADPHERASLSSIAKCDASDVIFPPVSNDGSEYVSAIQIIET